MKEIRLNENKVALVDDDDFEYLNKFRWYCGAGNKYAMRKGISDDEPKIVYMHRVITQAPKGLVVDHIDMNRLNNQKCNLRVCEHRQNDCNKYLQSNNTIGYKGVIKVTYKHKDGSTYCRYRTRLQYKKKAINGHYHDTPEEAAKEYNEMALKYFGEFAYLNKV